MWHERGLCLKMGYFLNLYPFYYLILTYIIILSSDFFELNESL